jgi:hypothetical protein
MVLKWSFGNENKTFIQYQAAIAYGVSDYCHRVQQ